MSNFLRLYIKSSLFHLLPPYLPFTPLSFLLIPPHLPLTPPHLPPHSTSSPPHSTSPSPSLHLIFPPHSTSPLHPFQSPSSLPPSTPTGGFAKVKCCVHRATGEKVRQHNLQIPLCVCCYSYTLMVCPCTACVHTISAITMLVDVNNRVIAVSSMLTVQVAIKIMDKVLLAVGTTRVLC